MKFILKRLGFGKLSNSGHFQVPCTLPKMADPFSVSVVPGHKNCLYTIKKHAVMGYDVENLSLRGLDRMQFLA